MIVTMNRIQDMELCDGNSENKINDLVVQQKMI